MSDYFIELITNHSKTNEIDILDYGSGLLRFNFTFIKKLSDQSNSTPVSLVLIFTVKKLNELNKNYKQINFVDFKELPKDLNYNFVILSDVLHHVE